MPNHVTNKLVVEGPLSLVEALLAQGAVVDKDGEKAAFSLRGFVPPPDHPDYTAGSCGHPHGFAGEPNDPHANCWYPWNIKNWGTKWDCYDVVVKKEAETVLDTMSRLGSEQRGRASIYFDTAWSPPFPVIAKIVELYPGLEIEFTHMDEDMFGAGGGRMSFIDGELVEERDGIRSKDDPEFLQIAGDLKGFDPADYEDEDE